MRVGDSEVDVSFILKALSIGVLVGVCNHFLILGINTGNALMIIGSLLGILIGISCAVYLRREM